MEITAGGRAVRTLKRRPPMPGNNLTLSVDIELQRVVEQAFGDRRGALIAIEPKSGDLLAFVSMPTFDPNLFVDGIDPKNWDELNNDPDKPLLNRALRGTYPIGSTYKPFLALAALETGKRRPETVIQDNGTFVFGNRVFRDSNKVPLGAVEHARVDRQVERHLLLPGGQRPGRRHDPRLHEAVGLRPDHRHRRRGRADRHPAVERLEGAPLQAEVVSRRDDLDRHRPGLQRVHAAATGARHGESRQRRRRHEAAPGQGGRGPAHRGTAADRPARRATASRSSPST